MTEYSGIVLDLDEATYHAHPALSSTGARKLLESPATFRHYADNPQEPKAAFDVGTAAHTKVLGVGAGIVAYPKEHLTPAGNVSTSKATVAWAAEQRASGFTPVSPHDVAAVDRMAESILAHPEARQLIEGQAGHPEASVFATDPASGVPMRARFDILAPVCVDVKTTAKSAAKASFEYTVWKFGYDVQQEHYRYTHELVTGETRPMRFVVVEKDAPHLVGVYELDTIWEQMGRRKVRVALEMFAECTALNDWPGLPTTTQLASPPVGAIYEHEEKYEHGEVRI